MSRVAKGEDCKFSGISLHRFESCSAHLINLKLKMKNWEFDFSFSILSFQFITAHVAQLVEHTLGKGEVTSSILVAGLCRVVMGRLSDCDHVDNFLRNTLITDN